MYVHSYTWQLGKFSFYCFVLVQLSISRTRVDLLLLQCFDDVGWPSSASKRFRKAVGVSGRGTAPSDP